MDGPLTVLDAAFTMQRRYIVGMNYETEGAKDVFDTYVEICAQLEEEIPKYVEVYLKGISIIVLHLSTAQAQYYDDTSKVFEMVFREKGLKGDSESYRRNRPNGDAPKLRAVSIYQAMAENRLPEPKEMDYGSYGCGEGHTRAIWEETAANHISQLVAGAATANDRLKEHEEWRKKHRGESASNIKVLSLLSRLTSKSKPSIGSRSSPAINKMRDSPASTPPESPLNTSFYVDQRSPSSPTSASLPATGNLYSRQGSSKRVRPGGSTLQRTATAPSAMGLPHGPPTGRRFTPGHHRSQSHGYPQVLNNFLPAIPHSGGGQLMGTLGGPPVVPHRLPGSHQRQRSEGQLVMGGLKLHIGQPGAQDNTLGKQPSTRHGRQHVSAQLVTVVANVPQPITKQFVKADLTQKLRNNQEASGSMQPAAAPQSISSQYHSHAKYSRSRSQPRAHGQPPAGVEYNTIVPPLPSSPGVLIAPREGGNQASTSHPHPSNATVEPAQYRVLPNFIHPPVASPTRASKPLSQSVPSALDIGGKRKTKNGP